MLTPMMLLAVAPPPLTATPAAPPPPAANEAVTEVAEMSSASVAVTETALPPLDSEPTPVT